jgi:hypothetical protein
MKLKQFHESRTCTTRRNCGVCRARTPRGERYRAGWALGFANFDPAAPCPFGVPWDYVAPARSSRPGPPHDSHIIAQRAAICDGCDEQLGWESPDRLKVFCARIPKETCARGCLSLRSGRCSEWAKPPGSPPQSSSPNP